MGRLIVPTTALLLSVFLLACDGKRAFLDEAYLDLEEFGQNVQATLDNQVVGYSLVITHGGLAAFSASDGYARTSFDGPARTMSVNDRIQLASVSKTITAAGVLRLLEATGHDVDESIASYLPSSWRIGQNVKGITFAQLLTHTSGFRDTDPNGVRYSDLEAIVAAGIKLSDKAYCSQQPNGCYESQNFALFRIIIPYLAGFSESGVSDMEAALAQAYVDYIKANVLTSSVAPGASCNSYLDPAYYPNYPDHEPVLYYPFPAGSTNGHDWGDTVLECGSSGWYLSAMELARFLYRLTSTDFILSSNQRAAMRDRELGWYDVNWTYSNGATTGYTHTGRLMWNIGSKQAEVNTFYVWLQELGVSLVLLVNSQKPARLESIVRNAFDNAWELK